MKIPSGTFFGTPCSLRERVAMVMFSLPRCWRTWRARWPLRGLCSRWWHRWGPRLKWPLIYFNLTRSPTFLQVEDDGTAIAEAVRNVMNLTFDPISKQPFFVGMIKMCHQVRSTRLRDDEVEKLFCSNASAQNKTLRSWIVKDPFVKIGFHPTPLKEEIVVPPTADNSAEVKVFVHRPKRLKGPRWCILYLCVYIPNETKKRKMYI